MLQWIELFIFNGWTSKLFLVLQVMQLLYSCAVLLLYFRLMTQEGEWQGQRIWRFLSLLKNIAEFISKSFLKNLFTQPLAVGWPISSDFYSFLFFKSLVFRGAWESQLSVCLWLRSWCWGFVIQPQALLLAPWWACFTTHSPPPMFYLSLSNINKIKS